MTSLGDDARETFTIAGLEKAKERSLEQHLRLRAPQTWTVLCASVDQYLRTTVGSSTQPTPMDIGAVMSTCACCGKAGHEKARCRFRNAKCSNCGKTGHLRAMCRQREKSAGKSSPSSSSGESSGKGGTSRGNTDKCCCCGQVGHRRPDCPRRNESCSLCGGGPQENGEPRNPTTRARVAPSLPTLRRQPGLLGRDFERDPPCAMPDSAWRCGRVDSGEGRMDPFPLVVRICPCERLSVLSELLLFLHFLFELPCASFCEDWLLRTATGP